MALRMQGGARRDIAIQKQKKKKKKKKKKKTQKSPKKLMTVRRADGLF